MPVKTNPKIRLNLKRLNVQALARDRETLKRILPICREVLRRKDHPSRKYKPDSSPDRNQLAFHKSQAAKRLISGGNQSGKSRCAAQEIMYWLTGEHPYQPVPKGAKVWVIGASYVTIVEGIWNHLVQIMPEWFTFKRGRNVDKYELPKWVKYRNPRTGAISKIEFFSAEAVSAARKRLQAAAVDLIAIDEEVAEHIGRELQVRRLARGGRMMITATLVNAEPWILDIMDAAEAGDPTVEAWAFSTRAAARAGHVSQDTFDELYRTFSEDDRIVRLEGGTTRRKGLIYSDFGRANMIEPFPIPLEWPRHMALDPGHRTLAALWVAVSPTGKFYVYRELYLHHSNYLDAARRIFLAERWDNLDGHGKYFTVGPNSERVKTRLIDPSAFYHAQSGELGTAHLFAEKGLFFAPAYNQVDYGIERVKQAIAPGIDGKPQLLVFSSLEKFRLEIKNYRMAKDTEDPRRSSSREKPVKKLDHLMDCMRYLVASDLRYEEQDVQMRERDYESTPTVEFTVSLEERNKAEFARIRAQTHDADDDERQSSWIGMGRYF